MQVTADPVRTQHRSAALAAYLDEQVLKTDGTFCCSHHAACRTSRLRNAFYEGQLPHLGRNYDLSIDGRPMRIVFVGQEYGTGETAVQLAMRSAMVERSARTGFSGRNPHMKGTTSLLRLLHGRALGTDADGERLLDGHIFDGFALVNYLACSSLRAPRGDYVDGAAKGDSSSTMRRNCGSHFKRMIEILEPTLIVAQGQGVRRWFADAIGLPRQAGANERAAIGAGHVDILTFNHPSAGGASGYWGNSVRSRYLIDVIAPAIAAYLGRA